MTRWVQPSLGVPVLHPYRAPTPTRIGYRARCGCGWEAYVSDVTKRDARDRWQRHAWERPAGRVS